MPSKIPFCHGLVCGFINPLAFLYQQLLVIGMSSLLSIIALPSILFIFFIVSSSIRVQSQPSSNSEVNPGYIFLILGCAWLEFCIMSVTVQGFKSKGFIVNLLSTSIYISSISIFLYKLIQLHQNQQNLIWFIPIMYWIACLIYQISLFTKWSVPSKIKKLQDIIVVTLRATIYAGVTMGIFYCTSAIFNLNNILDNKKPKLLNLISLDALIFTLIYPAVRVCIEILTVRVTSGMIHEMTMDHLDRINTIMLLERSIWISFGAPIKYSRLVLGDIHDMTYWGVTFVSILISKFASRFVGVLYIKFQTRPNDLTDSDVDVYMETMHRNRRITGLTSEMITIKNNSHLISKKSDMERGLLSQSDDTKSPSSSSNLAIMNSSSSKSEKVLPNNNTNESISNPIILATSNIGSDASNGYIITATSGGDDSSTPVKSTNQLLESSSASLASLPSSRPKDISRNRHFKNVLSNNNNNNSNNNSHPLSNQTSAMSMSMGGSTLSLQTRPSLRDPDKINHKQRKISVLDLASTPSGPVSLNDNDSNSIHSSRRIFSPAFAGWINQVAINTFRASNQSLSDYLEILVAGCIALIYLSISSENGFFSSSSSSSSSSSAVSSSIFISILNPDFITVLIKMGFMFLFVFISEACAVQMEHFMGMPEYDPVIITSKKDFIISIFDMIKTGLSAIAAVEGVFNFI